MAALKHLTPSAAVRPPIGPMTAEQAAAPTMTAGPAADITDRGMLEIANDELLKLGNVAGLLPMTKSAIAASVPGLDPESTQGAKSSVRGQAPGWKDRYQQALKYNDAAQYSADQQLPSAHALEAAGTMAAASLLPETVLGPVSAGLRWARPALGLAGRTLAGVLDAAVTNAGLSATKEWDDPKRAGQAAMQGATDPINALGALGPLLGGASEALNRAAASRALKTTAASPQASDAMREEFGAIKQTPGSGTGTSPSASEWLRDAKNDKGDFLIQKGGSAEDRYQMVKDAQARSGEGVGQIVDLAHNGGAKIDVPALKAKFMDIHKQHVTKEAIAADGPTTDRISKMIGDLMDLADGTLYPKAPIKITNNIPPNPIPNDDIRSFEKTKTAMHKVVADSQRGGQPSQLYKAAVDDASGVIKSADEEAVGRALGPEAVDNFVRAKSEHAKLSTMVPIYKNAADAEASVSSGGQGTNAGLDFLKHHLLATAGAALAGVGAASGHNGPGTIALAALGGGAVNKFAKANASMTRAYDFLGRSSEALKGMPATAPLAELLHQTGDGKNLSPEQIEALKAYVQPEDK